MAVPVPNINPLQIDGGVAHFKYAGAIGTLGPTLTIDLTDIPERLRGGAFFRDQLYITIQALLAADEIDVDISSLTVLPAAPALPEYAQLDATAVNAAGELIALVETHHSIGR